MNKAIIILFIINIHLYDLFAQVDTFIINRHQELKEIIIKPPTQIITAPLDGDLKIKTSELQKIPQLLSAVDLVRTAQLLPGISTTGDISSGLYIQGSEPSHNLFLINGAPIYNSGHLFGIFPTINADHFSDMQIDKGFISSQNGGRVGSVISLQSKKNAPEDTNITTNIGLVMSDATVDIPLNKKGNILISGRGCYLNPILKAFENISSDEKISVRYNIYDINTTLNYHFSDKDRIQLSSYFSDDKVKLKHKQTSLDTNYKWINFVSSFNWEHTFSNKFSLNTTLYNSLYKDKLLSEQYALKFILNSSINDFGGKLTFKHQLQPQFNIIYGGDFANRNISHQYPKFTGMKTNSDKQNSKQNNTETSVFAQADYTFYKKLKTTVAVRYGGIVKYDSNIEPRIELSYKFNDKLNSNLSYTHQHQYITQVLVSNMGLPINYLIGTSERSPSQSSDNFMLSFNYKRNNWNASISAYYRQLYNMYENICSLPATMLKNIDIYDRYAIGNGQNMGIEALFNYSFGRFSGWVAYTLSNATRSNEQISKTKYLANYDRLHDLSLVFSFDINDNWQYSNSFIYATGVPTTKVNGIYVASGSFGTNYSGYNTSRMPDYHRLDISFIRKLNIKWLDDSSIYFSAINAYARKNPFFHRTKVSSLENQTGLIIEPKDLAIFTIIPSVGLTLRF